ncbi:MAG: HYC_CC_PP family protein [Flavobacteriaceae bacterium]
MLKKTKAFVALLLATLVLASGAKIGFNFHYCQDDLARISWNIHPKNCLGEVVQQPVNSIANTTFRLSQKPCCFDQNLSVDTDTPDRYSYDFEIPTLTILITYPSTDRGVFTRKTQSSATPWFDPPDIVSAPLYLQFSRLIHYG